MGKKYTRSKKKFKTNRSAWLDVGRKTGLRPNQVRNKHTSKLWVFIRK